MSSGRPRFDELLAQLKQLPRAEQVRLFEALGLEASVSEERPQPESGDEYVCGECGALLPHELPDSCPKCGAPSEVFVLEAED